MKNKLFNSITLTAVWVILFYGPLLAQSNDPEGKTAKKDKLEQRSQDTGAQPGDPSNQGNHAPSFDTERPHRGWKQNFKYGPFRHHRFQHPGFYRRGFNAYHFYGQSFRSQSFRHHGLRSGNFRNPNFGGQGFYSRGFRGKGFGGQHYGKPYLRARSQNPEIKALKEQIWKDGVMDIKERDLLHAKMKEFRHEYPRFKEKPNSGSTNDK